MYIVGPHSSFCVYVGVLEYNIPSVSRQTWHPVITGGYHITSLVMYSVAPSHNSKITTVIHNITKLASSLPSLGEETRDHGPDISTSHVEEYQPSSLVEIIPFLQCHPCQPP